MSVVKCIDLKKAYQGAVKTEILKGINITIEASEQVAILGQSGSGKSTLLHLLGALDKPSSGEISILDTALSGLSDTETAAFRNKNLGFIYQFHHLLMEFTALENVCMPLLIAGRSEQQAQQEAKSLLALVGLSHRLDHKPSQLSGGERQRVAIARALVNKPKLVLADEPTGNLDKQNAEQIFDLFLKVNKELGTTLVVVTHDQQLASRFDRVIQLDDGRVA